MMNMPETEQRAVRLAGICKKCHSFRFGYLEHGTGPFVCHQCATAGQKTQPTGTGTSYFTVSFTANNSTSNCNEGAA